MTEQEIKVLMDLHKKGILTDEALAMALNTAAENVNVQEYDEDIVENYQEGQREVVQNARNRAKATRERQAQRDKERLEMEAARRRQEELDRISQEKEDELTEKIEYLSKLRNKNGELIYSDLEEERNAITSPKEYYEFIDEINRTYEQYKEHPEFIDEINKEYEKRAKQEEARKAVKGIEPLEDKELIDGTEAEIESDYEVSSEEEPEEKEEATPEKMAEAGQDAAEQFKNDFQEEGKKIMEEKAAELNGDDSKEEKPLIEKDAEEKDTKVIDLEELVKEPVKGAPEEETEQQEEGVIDLTEKAPDKGRQPVKRITTAALNLIKKIDSNKLVMRSLAAIGAISVGSAIVGLAPALIIGGTALAGKWVVNQVKKGAAAAGKSR
jgi:nucleolar protein involved in exit from mitosis